MRYPDFFDRFRDADPQHLDRRGGRPALRDLADLASGSSAGRAPPDRRLVAFFATGDSIVANNLVLNLYQHVNAPEGRACTCRGSCSRRPLHVQFYLTLLDTYLPDPERARRGVRGRREHPVDPAQGRVLLHAGSTRSSGCGAAATPRRARRVPAQPDLLRRLHRGPVLLRRLRLRLLPAVARACSTGWPSGTNWVFRDEACTWRSPSTVVDTVRARGAGAVRRRAGSAGRADDGRGGRRARRRSPRTCSPAASPGLSLRDMREYLQYVRRPAPGAPSGLAKRYGSRNPFAFMELQDVQELSELLRAPGLGLPGRGSATVSLDDDF